MVKRYQILLNEWQAEHYKMLARKYDVSFSEMIRMALCLDMIEATKVAFPKHKWKIDEKLLRQTIKDKALVGRIGRYEFHNFLSRLYFEVRKASELWRKKLEEDIAE